MAAKLLNVLKAAGLVPETAHQATIVCNRVGDDQLTYNDRGNTYPVKLQVDDDGARDGAASVRFSEQPKADAAAAVVTHPFTPDDE